MQIYAYNILYLNACKCVLNIAIYLTIIKYSKYILNNISYFVLTQVYVYVCIKNLLVIFSC